MKVIIGFLLVLNLSFGFAQQDSAENWKTLGGLEYEKGQDDYGEVFLPKFNEPIQKLEGKEIVLSGYIIPFEGMFSPDHLIISSVPVASCFFCGGAGPESVAEIYLKETVKYTAKKVTVSGKLKLNSTDIDQLMYILEDATLEIR